MLKTMRCNRPLRYKSRKVCSILILTHEYNVLCAFYIDISIILYKALKLALSQIKVFCKISTQFYTKLLLEIDAETSCLHFLLSLEPPTLFIRKPTLQNLVSECQNSLISVLQALCLFMAENISSKVGHVRPLHLSK